MPKISLWRNKRDSDYRFADRSIQEYFNASATAAYIHKYIGTNAGDETVIEDPVFLENRDRRYDDTIFELRGHYTPQDNDFDLSQFGIFLTNDTLFMNFHLNEMVDRLGRKLMSGDVIELPHLREHFQLVEDKNAINRFYVVKDASRYSRGYGPTWYPHIWRTKLEPITDSREYRDILGTGVDENGNPNDDLRNDQSTYNKDLEYTDLMIDEAECEVSCDPTFFRGQHLYIHIPEDDVPYVFWGTGDGQPPNGAALLGQGDTFPINMQDGEYFLRTDFDPACLFLKSGCKFYRIEYALCQPWTGQNRQIDTYIDNDNVTTHDDCSTEPEKQALSKVVRPRVDENGNGDGETF